MERGSTCRVSVQCGSSVRYDVVNRQTFLGIAQQRMSLDIYGRGFVGVRVSVLHSYDNLLPVTTINMCGAKHYYRRRWNGS